LSSVTSTFAEAGERKTSEAKGATPELFTSQDGARGRYLSEGDGMTDQLRTDAQLLRAFVVENDQDAFAEIVDRHGPMVGRVSFRIIGDAAEAQDAAQAVFLVLVKKAASLRRNATLSSWLHGVARTISLTAIRGRARRQQREETYAMTQEMVRDGAQADAEAKRANIIASLDRELARLSERQRQAVVLRYLEWRPPTECAAIAGCSAAALRRRASDGVAKLRRRFAKRGLLLSAGALLAALESEAHAVIAPTLLPSVMTATKGLVAGATSTAVSITVSSLVEGGIRMLFWKHASVVGCVTILAAATGLLSVHVAASEDATRDTQTERRPARPLADETQKTFRAVLDDVTKDALVIRPLRAGKSLREAGPAVRIGISTDMRVLNIRAKDVTDDETRAKILRKGSVVIVKTRTVEGASQVVTSIQAIGG
jgi:RNA polymerase sigma factor (sigma-70 family)